MQPTARWGVAGQQQLRHTWWETLRPAFEEGYVASILCTPDELMEDPDVAEALRATADKKVPPLRTN